MNDKLKHINILPSGKAWLSFFLLLSVVSCSDVTDIFNDSPVEFEDGEKVAFTTNVPTIANVSSRAYTPDNELLRGYSTISDDYTLSIKMLEENAGNSLGNSLGTCTYKPVTTDTGYDSYGKLQATPGASEGEFYWTSNVKKYAFEATAGTETLEVDQSTREKWFAQDRLHGYAFAPLLDTDNSNQPVDKINAPNFHTNKEWGAMNKAWRDATEEGVMHKPEDYKQIPLFLQHQRSWITLILKAGNGVSRDALKFENAQKNINVSFFNYANGEEEPTVFNMPLLKKATVDYAKDKNGEEQKGVETTEFNVIVDPHNYTGDNASKDKIAAIDLSGLKFSFFAANDVNYPTSGEPTTDDQKRAMAAYNLEAGKHLTITATLSTDRIVFITAWIEDWTEVATSTICDDYGQNGDPILINSRQDLIDFLNNESDNKSGNVAIVVANSLDLDKNIQNEYYEEGDEIPAGKKVGDIKSTTSTDDPWSKYAGKTLKATLNLAGAKFSTSSQILGSIESSGSIINGTVVMNNASPVESAISETNSGTVERVNVIPQGGAKASKAGLVVTNHGTIYQCTSTLPVYGTAGYLGGIAAESTSSDGTTMPVIDACTVNAPVKGTIDVTAAGGIVGLADGRVTNNVNEYGITLLQDASKFKNIIGKQTERTLRASHNSWPTKADNSFSGDGANENANTTARYHNVLDCQEELKALLSNQYNVSDGKYRIAADFTVNSEFWKRDEVSFIGQQHDDISTHDDLCNGNLYCELDGNNKTITLDGSAKVQVPTAESGGKATAYESKTTSAMLFSNITGKVHDLTIYLAKPLIAKPSANGDGVLTSTDAIAPLAYSVRGADAIVSNIKIKMADDAYVQSATPAGLVCWANEGATIDNCQVKGKILSWLPNVYNGTGATEDIQSGARRYAGGIVAAAAKATIKSCIFYPVSNTLKEAKTTPSGAQEYYGGILGGTVVKDISSSFEEPAVSIVDCISWFAPNKDTEPTKGAIVGRAQYTSKNDNHNHNGTVTSGPGICQGNWWNTTSNGVADRLDGETTESVIGKCNAATPTIDTNY